MADRGYGEAPTDDHVEPSDFTQEEDGWQTRFTSAIRHQDGPHEPGPSPYPPEPQRSGAGGLYDQQVIQPHGLQPNSQVTPHAAAQQDPFRHAARPSSDEHLNYVSLPYGEAPIEQGDLAQSLITTPRMGGAREEPSQYNLGLITPEVSQRHHFRHPVNRPPATPAPENPGPGGATTSTPTSARTHRPTTQSARGATQANPGASPLTTQGTPQRRTPSLTLRQTHSSDRRRPEHRTAASTLSQSAPRPSIKGQGQLPFISLLGAASSRRDAASPTSHRTPRFPFEYGTTRAPRPDSPEKTGQTHQPQSSPLARRKWPPPLKRH